MISDCIADNIPPQMKILIYGYPHSNALLQSRLILERCKQYKAARYPMRCDIINDVKLFPTVHRRIYCIIQSNVALQKQEREK